MNIRSLEDELFQADGQKDMTKLIFAFRSLAKSAYKCVINSTFG